METLREALARLERRGFTASFRAEPEGFRAIEAGRHVAPERLVVDEVVRFEGESDPEEAAVLFALHSDDGALRGTFVSSYGPSTDPIAAELVARLDASHDTGHRLPSA